MKEKAKVDYLEYMVQDVKWYAKEGSLLPCMLWVTVPITFLTCSWRMQIFPSGPREVRKNIVHIWLLDQCCPIDLTVMAGVFYHLPCPLWQPAATACVKCDSCN